MPQSPEDLPITGMCIVSDPNQCPHGYEVLFRSQDKLEDCDLWKDSFFRSKVTRYLCFTRIFPLDGGRLNNVLGDIVINNERDPPPNGFSIVDFTVDSREKATRKKQVCVRMLPRETTHDAICDVIILSRNKRPPIGYTLVGEINGLLICFKMGQVPPDSKSPTVSNHTPTSAPLAGSSFDFAEWAQSLRQSYPLSPRTQGGHNWSLPSPPSPFLGTGPNHSGSPPVNTKYSLSPQIVRSPPPPPSPKQNFQRQDSLLLPGAALEGVPFTLSPKYQDVQGLSMNNVPEVTYRSLVDIENEYSYNFRLERTAAAQQLTQSQ